MAPEVFRGEEHDHRIDIWALGVILFEMIVGIPPFNDDNVENIFLSIMKRDITDWEYLQSVLEQETISIIEFLLNPDQQ